VSAEAKVPFLCCVAVLIVLLNQIHFLGFGEKVVTYRSSSKANSLSSFIKSVDNESRQITNTSDTIAGII